MSTEVLVLLGDYATTISAIQTLMDTLLPEQGAAGYLTTSIFT